MSRLARYRLVVSDPNLVWRYATRDVIEKIITDHEFWTADVGRLKDVTEIRLGNTRVRQAFKALRDNWDWRDDAALISTSMI